MLIQMDWQKANVGQLYWSTDLKKKHKKKPVCFQQRRVSGTKDDLSDSSAFIKDVQLDFSSGNVSNDLLGVCS